MSLFNNNKPAPGLPATTAPAPSQQQLTGRAPLPADIAGLSEADAKAKVAELLRRNAELEAAAKAGRGGGGKITMKVSDKGAVSFYGLRRFPVTLYLSEVERLIPLFTEGKVKEFIDAHRGQLTVKPTE